MAFAQLTKDKPKVFQAAGKCIYCGDNPPEGLTREHVMPLGLGGGFVFPDASCEKCRKITHKFETICLRKLFIAFRLDTGLVRHIKEIKKLKDQPSFIVLPQLLEVANIINGGSPGSSLNYKLGLHANSEEMQKRARQAGGFLELQGQFELSAFFRMVAKIAHGFAAGEIGLQHFVPRLTPLILGDHDFLIPHLIGNDPQLIPSPQVKNASGRYWLAHQIGWAPVKLGGHHGIYVGLRLFGITNAPAYGIICGDIKPESEAFVRGGLRGASPI